MNFNSLLNAINLTPAQNHRQVLQPRPLTSPQASSGPPRLGSPFVLRPTEPKTLEAQQGGEAAPPPRTGLPLADLFTVEPLHNATPVRVEQAFDVTLELGPGDKVYPRSPEPRGLSADHRRQLRVWGWTSDDLEALRRIGEGANGEANVEWVFHKHMRLQHFGFSIEQVMDLVLAPKTAREFVVNGLERLGRWFSPDELIELAQCKGATRFMPKLAEYVPEVLRRGYQSADVLRLLEDGHGQRKLWAFAHTPWPYPADLSHEQLLHILDHFIKTEIWRDEAYG